jgi:hypothetical protein
MSATASGNGSATPSAIGSPSVCITAPGGLSVSTWLEGRLVENANEQAALEAGRTMQANGLSLRAVASEWKYNFGLGQYDAKTVQRILERHRAATESVGWANCRVHP